MQSTYNHLLRDRLPTTDNLIKRHILHPNAQLCVGCGVIEDAKHLFLSCDFFWQTLVQYFSLAWLPHNVSWKCARPFISI